MLGEPASAWHSEPASHWAEVSGWRYKDEVCGCIVGRTHRSELEFTITSVLLTLQYGLPREVMHFDGYQLLCPWIGSLSVLTEHRCSS